MVSAKRNWHRKSVSATAVFPTGNRESTVPDADILADICKALNISPSELLDVRLSPEDLSEQERKVIMAYRTKPDLRKAVNILLGIE